MAPVLVLSVCGSRSGDVKTPSSNRIECPVDTRRVAVIIGSSMGGEAGGCRLWEGFDLVLSLRGLTIEREICRAVPGSDEQATEWRQLYEAYGFSERRRD